MFGLGTPKLLFIGMFVAVLVILSRMSKGRLRTNRICAACGRSQAVPPGAVFCAFCGKKLP